MADTELLARVDERVRELKEDFGTLRDDFQSLRKKLENGGLLDRIVSLEKEMALVKNQNNAWLKWAEWGWKVLATILGAVICWKLGISAGH